jgi:hypothetical protein
MPHAKSFLPGIRNQIQETASDPIGVVMDGHCIDGNGSAGIERFTDNRATLRPKGDLAESVVGSCAGGFRVLSSTLIRSIFPD